MPTVSLVLLTPEEQQAFVAAQAADYAAWLVDQGRATDPAEALALARAEIEPDMAAAVQEGDAFWTARDARDGTVGWLWVKVSVAGVPPGAAFLYQILVKPEVRRRGYGAEMLDALERVLAAAGWRALHLNVWDTNTAGRRLYERGGYMVVERLPAKQHLHKQLVPADPG